ncbi:MAG: CRISPR-associated endonuclease Cas2 [Thermoplasmata archaeon]|nr:MAG: CRISPR-associated endonuclease Cas2 [Thermoplasmata archaeon]
MKNRLYIVSYDIRDPKRLRKVEKTMKGFGWRLHYSVFRCHLTEGGLIELKAALDEIINHDEDRIMIVDMGPLSRFSDRRIIFLGQKPPEIHDGELIF